MRMLTKGEWAFLAVVGIYSFVPAFVGLIRIPELLGGPAIVPSNPRAVIDPVPIVLHILGSSVFCLAGAVQFLPRLRCLRPAFHRSLGRVVATAGCISALTGFWMTMSYSFPEALQGPLLFWVRITLSLTMLALIVWALVAVRCGNIAGHYAAMLRAYAIGQGASTQTALFIIAMTILGSPPLGVQRDILMVSAWVANIALAELLIRSAVLLRAQRLRGYGAVLGHSPNAKNGSDRNAKA